MSDLNRRQLVVHEDIELPTILNGPQYETAVRDAAARARRRIENFARLKSQGTWTIDEDSWEMAVVPVSEDPVAGYSRRLTMSVVITRATDG